MHPSPENVVPGSLCWYRPHGSKIWYLGRFQQYMSYVAMQYAHAMVVTLYGKVVDVDMKDISFAEEKPEDGPTFKELGE